MNLNEGLQTGDLTDLVLPIISIDEYESKIDDDNIVVAFYVKDKEPAADLARFISKSEIDILDAEVSPVPNSEGYYLVFVEFIRNKEFIISIVSLVDSMYSLTEVDSWQFKGYKQKVKPFSEENIKASIRIDDEPTKLETILMNTANTKLFEGRLAVEEELFDVIAIGNTTHLYEKYGLNDKAIMLDNTASYEQRILNKGFGPGWNVDVFETVIAASTENRTVLLNRNL